MAKKSAKSLWEEYSSLIFSGTKENIEQAFASAKDEQFDLEKRLEPWKKVLKDFSADRLVKFFKVKKLIIDGYFDCRTIPLYQQISEVQIEIGGKFPKALCKLPHLKKITCDFLDSDIPFSADDVSHIEQIAIRLWRPRSGDSVLSLCSFENSPVTVQELQFWGDRFTLSDDLMVQIRNIRGLEKISFHGNSQAVPEELKNIPLKNLTFYNVPFSTFPEWFFTGELQKLKEFHFSIGNLQRIPDSIERWQNLTSLHITGNLQLQKLPEALGNLNSLEDLRVSGNCLNDLPVSIGSLPNLKSLSIGSNSFHEIPECVFSLAGLKELDVSNNPIETISYEMQALTELTVLWLYRTEITVIPDFVGKFKYLTKLCLSDTHISVIPDTLGDLENLSQLLISHTQITAVPDTFQKLRNLAELDIRSNEIRRIPDFLRTMPNLKFLSADN